MRLPGMGVHHLGNTSSLGEIKFAMHIVAHMIMGFVFIRYYKGRIPNSTDLKLYVTYCVLVIISSFVYIFRTGDANLVMSARALDLFLFVFTIMVLCRMEIKDSFSICLISISAPVFILLSIFLVSPELAFTHISSSTGESDPRLGGDFIHPNHLGACAAISLIMFWGTKIGNFPKILLSLTFIWVIFQTESRTAILALTFSIIGSQMLERGRVIKKMILLCSLLFITVAGYWWYQEGLGEIIPKRLLQNLDTLTGRTLIWEIALNRFFNGSAFDLLFGIDPFFSRTIFDIFGLFKTFGLHNSYLHVLIGCGVFAAIIYTLMLVLLLRTKAPTRELTLLLKAIAIFLILMGFTEPTAAVYMNFFIIPFALLIAGCYRQKISLTTNSKFSGRLVFKSR